MQEFEPKKRNKILTKEFLAKNAYVLVLAVLLLGGIAYGYTFFIQNRKIASGSITTAALTINFTDRSISASNLSVPVDDQGGLTEYSKSLTITNQTTVDGKVELTLTRTSGLALTDMSYALIVNGAIQEIDDVPSDGKILETAIMGNETVNVEVRLWPKTTYTGSTTTFVGELTPEIKYLGPVAADTSNLTGKYVNFNCNGSTCEVWQIVKVEDDRLVLTKQADYTNATSRTNSNRYNPTGSFNDDSLITSLSTDEKNAYLAKTVKITGGSGTVDNPYELGNMVFSEKDKKVIAVITYKDGTTTLGTQNVYYGETNYIGRTMNDAAFQYWDDGTNHYVLGDVITTITSDTNLSAYKVVNAVNLSFNNTITGFNCTDAQCALEELDNLVDPTAAKTILRVSGLETTPYGKIYTGSDPDNYVWFNNEQWRIIGVYGNQLKIVRVERLLGKQYNNSASDTPVWASSTIKTYLNGTYYNSISDSSMIDAATWNVGACNYNLATSDAYTCASGTTWTGMVGLIASYEYLYAAENNGTCWATTGNSYNTSCATTDWLFSLLVSQIYGDYQGTMLINPLIGGYPATLVIDATGKTNADASNSNIAASPVVYLKSNVIITGGNGGIGETNSYKLALGN